MRPDYPRWLAEQKYQENTQQAQIHRVRKVEECYGNLDEHSVNGTYQDIIKSLEYSTHDERLNKQNPSKIKFEGNVNIRNNLQSYKNAVVRYRKFLNDVGFQGSCEQSESEGSDDVSSIVEDRQQRSHLSGICKWHYGIILPA